MTGHTCPNCGGLVPCDKRQIGTGRQHDRDWKPNANHDTVIKALFAVNNGEWATVKQVQAFLNHYVNAGTFAKDDWTHKGKSTYWTQLAVQTPMSDLLGVDVVQCRRPTKGRELLYRVSPR